MPITRVLDERGAVIHDCADAGCSVSWDGYALAELEDVAAGERVEGASDPDPERWQRVDESTVRKTPRD